jgi:hypothetical protein
VQFLVIVFGNEHRVVIEKMDFLLIAHADVGMSAQKVVERRGAGFLRTGQNEVESLNFATFGSEQGHRARNRAHAHARVHDRLRA